MEKKIVFFGDSITDCARSREFDNARGYGYVTMVTGELGTKYPYQYQFINRGIAGNRSVDLLARVKSDVINLKPDYLSLLVGINDVSADIDIQNGVSAEQYEVILDMILSEVKTAQPEIRIMLLEPFVVYNARTDYSPEFPNRSFEKYTKEVGLRSAAVKRLAEKYNAVFVPLQEIFTAAEADAPYVGYWVKDGIHPTAFGHNLIKQEWLKAFETIR